MVEMIASDVPGSWRFLLYVRSLCGGANIYRCYWLPRWLRCLSVVYQVIILITYIIVITVAPAVYRPSPSLLNAFGNDICFIYSIPMLSNVVILRQTFHGSGEFALLSMWRWLQIGNLYAVKNKIRRGAVLIIVGSISVSLGIIFIGFSTFRTMELFPALDGHNTQNVIFWVHVIFRIFALVFYYSYIIFCFVVVTDVTFFTCMLRQQLDDVFSCIIVDAVALKKCVNCVNGIWAFVGAANGAFGVPLGMYLIGVLPIIITCGFRLVVELKVFYVLALANYVGILILILVPSAILAAQVKYLHQFVSSRDNNVMRHASLVSITEITILIH